MVEIWRTANAGCLLKLDGVSILLDGVCGEIPPFLPTPLSVFKLLKNPWPDIVAFTHTHTDHFDGEYVRDYQLATGREALLPGTPMQNYSGVSVIPVPSRHMGNINCPHTSYVISGSVCVWFMGDASPLQWCNRSDLPKPDVLIAPYSYAASDAAWRIVKELGAQMLILLHLPTEDNDPAGLHRMVVQKNGIRENVKIKSPGMLERINFFEKASD